MSAFRSTADTCDPQEHQSVYWSCSLKLDQRQQFINGTRTLPSSPYPFAPEEMMRFRRLGHMTL
jgi:hypothetical protein